MRRKVGVSALKKKQDEVERYSKVGKSLEDLKLSAISDVMTKFKTTLSEFANKHRGHRINSDPEFRHQFHTMCINVGVDPLASNKGFWANMLGVGDFYFELGLKIIEVGVQTRAVNGGIVPLATLLKKLNHRKNYSHTQASSSSSSTTANTTTTLITGDDVKRAVEKLATLGSGFQMIQLSNNTMVVVTVPLEVSSDHEQLLSCAQEDGGFVTERLMLQMYGWGNDRFIRMVTSLLREGMLWVDDHNGERRYYFYSIWIDAQR